MINKVAYDIGVRDALNFFKTAMPTMTGLMPRPALRPGAAGMHTMGGAQVPAPALGGTTVARPSAMGAAPAAPAPAAPAAPMPGAAPAAPGAKPGGGFVQALKDQAPSALLNTGLMMGVPLAMNAMSNSGQQPQG